MGRVEGWHYGSEKIDSEGVRTDGSGEETRLSLLVGKGLCPKPTNKEKINKVLNIEQIFQQVMICTKRCL